MAGAISKGTKPEEEVDTLVRKRRDNTNALGGEKLQKFDWGGTERNSSDARRSRGVNKGIRKVKPSAFKRLWETGSSKLEGIDPEEHKEEKGS